MSKYALALALGLALAPLAQAASYKVDEKTSSIGFSGTHAGSQFSGKFNKWDARLDIDPKNLTESCIEANFDITSAATGNAMYDGTLPTADWFNSKAHPKGRFVSTAITANKDGSYTAEGKLTLRGVTQPTKFNFNLTEQGFLSQGVITLDRIAYSIGKESDSKAQWVSKDISVQIYVDAPLAKEPQPKANCK